MVRPAAFLVERVGETARIVLCGHAALLEKATAARAARARVTAACLGDNVRKSAQRAPLAFSQKLFDDARKAWEPRNQSALWLKLINVLERRGNEMPAMRTASVLPPRTGRGHSAVPRLLTQASIILDMQFIQNAASLNQALDEMDFATGIHTGGGRIPVDAIAKAMQKGAVYNNIAVTNSQVGLINTGDLAKIDAAITMTRDTDAELIGQHLKTLTQAVIDSGELNTASKNELTELIQSLSEQIVGNRKRSVIMSLLRSIEERAKGVNAIAQLVSGLITAMSGMFS